MTYESDKGNNLLFAQRKDSGLFSCPGCGGKFDKRGWFDNHLKNCKDYLKLIQSDDRFRAGLLKFI